MLIYTLMSHQSSENRDANNKLCFKIKAANDFVKGLVCLFNHNEIKIYNIYLSDASVTSNVRLTVFCLSKCLNKPQKSYFSVKFINYSYYRNLVKQGGAWTALILILLGLITSRDINKYLMKQLFFFLPCHLKNINNRIVGTALELGLRWGHGCPLVFLLEP